MPKILMFTGHTSLKIGGLEEFFARLGSESADDLVLVENDYERIPDSVRTFFDERNLHVHRGSVGKTLLRAARDIAALLREHKPDIVHVNFQPVSYVAIVLARLLGARRIYWTKHSLLTTKRFSRTWWYHWFCMHFVDKVVCISASIDRELEDLRLARGKRMVLPLGINLVRFDRRRISGERMRRIRSELAIEEDDFVVTVVAQVRPVKRLDTFLEAVRILVRDSDIKKLRALIVGGTCDNEESAVLARRYAEFVEEKNLAAHVSFLGVRDDIATIYAVSDLAGLTSESEGLGLSLVEAAAMGMPLFGSRVGGIPEIVVDGQNGHTFEVADPAGLAEIIGRLINSKATREELGARSRRIAEERYDVAANTRTLAQLYGEASR
ncbi:MAG: glycosyltransferase family 4 protein [Candidatus Krumholzibacteria bacterium]